MPVTATWQQANRFTMARHGLLNRAWRDPVAAAGNLCGLHAQVPTTPPLSLWCRLTDFDGTTLDAALYRQRSLVKRWLMRGTLHLVPMRDLPIYHRAFQRAWGKSWGRYLARRQRTTPAKREARLYPVALAALDDGPLSRQAWRDRVQAQLDLAHRSRAADARHHPPAFCVAACGRIRPVSARRDIIGVVHGTPKRPAGSSRGGRGITRPFVGLLAHLEREALQDLIRTLEGK